MQLNLQHSKLFAFTALATSAAALVACGGGSSTVSNNLTSQSVGHVLMISIDGLHQQDLANCITANTCPNIASLSNTGVTYTSANTPGLSDSVPGLAALMTGGSPKTTGLFYDDIYDRTLYSGTDQGCTGTQGVEVFLQEVVGIDSFNGGTLAHLDGGGDFNPQQIPRMKTASGCLPVYPHNFIKTNTIFEVVRENMPGAFTAWADKHAWGTDWVNGPSGSGVMDLARTEINSDFNTAQGLATPAGFDFTNTPTQTKIFDHIHTQILINQIDGLDSTGVVSAAMGGSLASNKIPVPTVFGTNYQTLSVSQKALNANGGGYTDANFTPNTLTATAITYLDGEIGAIKAELAKNNLLNSTVIVISAKHGQTPGDRSKLRKIGDTIASTLSAAVGLGANSSIGSGLDSVTGNVLGTGQFTEDDVGFIWLNNQSDANRAAVVAALKANASCPTVDATTKIITTGQTNPGICAGTDSGSGVIDLKADGRFGDPTLGRTPDIMVQPNSGTIYSKSGKKDAEHGGSAPNDTNVALLVSYSGLAKQTVSTPVLTTQVAPTILKALKLDPTLLNSVRVEGTAVLPGLF